jgi:hypothetical protein
MIPLKVCRKLWTSLFKCVVTDKTWWAAGLRSGMILRVRTALFWAITQRVVAISYRHFETTSLYHPQGFFFLILEPWGCDRQDVRNVGKKLPLYSNLYLTRCNYTQFIYIWKLLYMFRVVPPPIISNANNCIYSVWYLSHRYCFWWWVQVPSETCRAVFRYK